jgi:hypothetical protein
MFAVARPSSRRPRPADGRSCQGTCANGNLGFEAEQFKAADKLRGNMEPSDYKHVAFSVIFLKHIPTASRPSAPSCSPLSRRSQRPRRVFRRECLLGSERGAPVASSSEREAALDRKDDRRGHDRHREALRNAERRLAEGLCLARTQRGRGWRTNRADFRNCTRPGKRRGARRSRSRLRLLPWPVRRIRRQARWRILYAAFGRARDGR